jgi:hypothetical protein
MMRFPKPKDFLNLQYLRYTAAIYHNAKGKEIGEDTILCPSV